MLKRVLLIAGHGSSDPGACSPYGKEADETRKVVEELVRQLSNYNVTTDVYPTNRNAYSDVCNGCVQKNFANYDYVFEVHFNSATASAHGVEIFVTTMEVGIAVEQAIVNNIAKLGFTNRGVKRNNFAVIRNAKNKGTSSALVEVCFISNNDDMNRYRNNFSNTCKAIVDGIVSGFGLTKKASTPYNPPPVQSNPSSYLVIITADVLNVRKGPGTSYPIATTVKKNEVYTIIEETNGWLKLKSGAGYISKNYTKRK